MGKGEGWERVAEDEEGSRCYHLGTGVAARGRGLVHCASMPFSEVGVRLRQSNPMYLTMYT